MKPIRHTIFMLCFIVVLASCQTRLDNINTSRSPTVTAYPSEITDSRYHAGNLEILIELGVATNEELSKDTYITTLEALQIIYRIIGFDDIDNVESPLLSRWYEGDLLAPLDGIDDTLKLLLLDLSRRGYNPKSILTDNDILNISLEEDLTNYHALIYTTRMIGDTYGCTDYPEELDFTMKEQTYNAAFQKGIIDNADMENADLPISREDFFDLVHKVIFVEYSIGGIATTSGKLIDTIIHKNEKDGNMPKKTEVYTKEISAETIISEYMFLSWIPSDEYSFLQNGGYSTAVQSITESGNITSHLLIGTFYDTVYPDDLIRIIITEYPKKLNYIRYVYYKYDDDYKTKEEWYLDFDISNIHLQIAGKAPNPGVYTHYKRQWVPEKISLSDGSLFKENAYYLLTSYTHEYRKPEYDSSSYAIFKATETSDTFFNSEESGRLIFQGSVVNTSDVHIQEITIQGNASFGFTLYVTPESTEAFEAKEGSDPS